eukprot:CAMPEP_0170411256 /NCGR_PEP_ID=MMETSP0117_2-20130122/30330_1 /TAXON_ID=400756 /ORGANISM="Durinskia baltica, Strain CSIRO CS-38" /LENGTH=31 /DNA_ID= /DNA_START= /DNA_END= /DNA_ORIENTATION=
MPMRNRPFRNGGAVRRPLSRAPRLRSSPKRR